MQRLKLPVVFMRGGTSKGLFFHERALPAEPETRDRFLLSAMGSPDPYGRQLDGMGGGISSLSKIIIIRRSTHPEADIDYLHGQVAVDRPVIDYSANCGNLSSAVGPFALEEGLISAGNEPEKLIRLHNLNTGKLIDARIPLRDGGFSPEGDFAMPGVAGSGNRIALEYLSPGKPGLNGLFPSGHAAETVELPGGVSCTISAAYASLPCVFVRAEEVGLRATMPPDEIDADRPAMALLEAIRREAGVRMGLATTLDEVPLASPKVGIVAAPADYTALDGTAIQAGSIDLLIRMISMGRAHKAVPLTGAMCLAATCLAAGSVPRACSGGIGGPEVRVGTPSGVLTVGAVLGSASDNPPVDRTIVYATARRLMDGQVHGSI